MFGFTNVGVKSDHVMGGFVRAQQAFDCQSVGSSNQWRNAAGDVVLVAFYSGPNGFVSAYWVRDELAASIP